MKPRPGSNKRRSQKRGRSVVQYDSLEQRQLLATDVGLAFTGSTFQTDSSYYPPDANGDVGRDHLVEVLNGRINMMGREDGVRVQSETMTQFFENAGATVFNDPVNPKVVFDRLTDRWFVAANGTGNGNWLYLAVSETSNPTGNWQHVQFVGDSTGIQFNDEITLSADADAVYLTTNNSGGEATSSIYSIPKTDLLAANATLTNMSRFEGLDPETFGSSIQVALNFEATDGQAIAIGTDGPSGVILTSIQNPDAAGATLGTPLEIDTDVNDEFSDVVPAEQPADPITEDELFLETTSEMTSGVIEVNGSVWGAKTVGLTDWLSNAAINWFEIDSQPGDSLGELVQSEIIHDGAFEQHFFNPSIAVNEFGVTAISYNFSGLATPVGAYTRVGITVNGLGERNTQLENQFQMEPGLQVHRTSGDTDFVSPWGETTSIHSDPDSVNSFFSVAPWANTVDRWTTHNAVLTPQDLQPVVLGDELDNTIIVRRDANDTNLLEIEFDGVVTDRFPYEVLGQVEIQAGAGDDQFILDYTNGNPVPAGGFLLIGGAGTDTVQSNNSDENTWTVGVNDTTAAGTGTYEVANQPEVTEFQQVEELVGGLAVDHFLINSSLAGSLVGRAGDDVFEFSGTGFIGDSVVGGEGYNTLSLLNRMNSADPPATPDPLPSEFFLLSTSAIAGFDGETPDGPIGGDEDTDQFQDISQLIGSETEVDTLHGLDVASTLTIDGANSTYQASGQTLDLDKFDTYHASSFDDVFNVRSNAIEQLRLFGLDGNDAYHFSSDAPLNAGTTDNIGGLVFAFGGAGTNTMTASNAAGSSVAATILSKRISGMGEIVFDAEIDGGTFDLTLVGSNQADDFLLHSFIDVNTMVVDSLDGDDTFDIQDLSKASVDVFGGLGNDLYVIESINGVDFRNLEIHDTPLLEKDRVSLRGTVLDEVFDINASTFVDLEVVYTGIEEFGALGRGGNDTFNITDFDAPLFVSGDGGNDVFNISSDAPANTGTVDTFTDDIYIDGGSGTNQLNISNMAGTRSPNAVITNNSISGLLPVTLYHSASGSFSKSDGSAGGIHIQGSTGDDIYNVVSLNAEDSLRFDGYAGADRFYVRANVLGDVEVHGDEGNDIYRAFFVGSEDRAVTIKDTAGNNRLSVFGTAEDDDFQISQAGIQRGEESLSTIATFSFMEVIGDAGADSFNMVSTSATTNFMIGQSGNDTFNINGSVGANGLRLIGDAGRDTFNLNTTVASTNARVLGGWGNDDINVMSTALGNVSSDGSEGSDTYTGHFVGAGTRWFGALDSGTDGTDTVVAVGTEQADSLIVRAANVYSGASRIAFGQLTEVLNVDAIGGSDSLLISASFADATHLSGGDGDDYLDIVGTTHIQNFSALMGAGDDTTIIRKTYDDTTAVVDGQSGDDQFIVGSYSAANTGNLGRMRGRLDIVGGSSDTGDHLRVNDGALSANYSYLISGDHILNDSGPNGFERAEFAGIYFDNTLENVRLDGTQGANHFLVAASQSTKFFLNGNTPTPDNTSGDEIELALQADDGHEFEWIDEAMGEGLWTFTNGNQNVEFESMETVDNPGSGG